MRQALAQDLSPPDEYLPTSAVVYVIGSIHDGEPAEPYGVGVPDIPDGPGKHLATLIRDARVAMGWRQDELADAAGVARQTIIQYESGRAANPEGPRVRAVLRALDLDPREATVILGFVTREELGLPPKERPLDKTVAEVQQMLDDQKIPQRQRDNLLRGVRSALDLWFDLVRIKPPREAAPKHRSPTSR